MATGIPLKCHERFKLPESKYGPQSKYSLKREAPTDNADVCDCFKICGETKYSIKRLKTAPAGAGYTSFAQDSELLDARYEDVLRLEQAHVQEVNGLCVRYDSKIGEINQANEQHIELLKKEAVGEIEKRSKVYQSEVETEQAARKAEQEQAQEAIQALQTLLADKNQLVNNAAVNYEAEVRRFNSIVAEKDQAAANVKTEYDAEKQHLESALAAKDNELQQVQAELEMEKERSASAIEAKEKELEQAKAELEAEKRRFASALTEKDSEINQIKAAHEAEKERLNDTITKKEKEVTEANELAAQYEKDAVTYGERCEKLMNDRIAEVVKKAEASEKTLLDEMIEMRTATAEHLEEIAAVKDEMNGCRANEERLESRNNAQARDIEELSETLHCANATIASLREDLQLLNDIHKEEDECYDELSKENEMQKAQIEHEKEEKFLHFEARQKAEEKCKQQRLELEEILSLKKTDGGVECLTKMTACSLKDKRKQLPNQKRLGEMRKKANGAEYSGVKKAKANKKTPMRKLSLDDDEDEQTPNDAEMETDDEDSAAQEFTPTEDKGLMIFNIPTPPASFDDEKMSVIEQKKVTIADDSDDD